MKKTKTKVVVTGLGLVTSLGGSLSETWGKMVLGDASANPIEHFNVAGCRCQFGASVRDIGKNKTHFTRSRRVPRAVDLLLPAAREALGQAFLLNEKGWCSKSMLPLSVSSTGGGMGLGEDFLRGILISENRVERRRKISQIARYQPQQQVLDLQGHFQFQGPVTLIANACASGANAIGNAADWIRLGRSDCVLSGGWEELSELLFVGFDSLKALSPDCCRPFDVDRNGLMLGEGAAFLVLESEEHALSREAEILCELKGYGHTTDLHHLTQPDPEGSALIRAMEGALKQAELAPSRLGYVNAHGTGTPLNDASEGAAFRKIFSSNLGSLRISSTKAAIGHTLGAAGAIEAVLSIQALRTGCLPPQVNLRNPEPCLAQSLASLGEKREMESVMSTNLGFGGSNAVLIFSRYES